MVLRWNTRINRLSRKTVNPVTLLSVLCDFYNQIFTRLRYLGFYYKSLRSTREGVDLMEPL